MSEILEKIGKIVSEADTETPDGCRELIVDISKEWTKIPEYERHIRSMIWMCLLGLECKASYLEKRGYER